MRNDFDTEFEVLEGNENDKKIKKIIVKVSIALAILIFFIFLMIRLFSDNKGEGEDIPLIEPESQVIKEKNNIEDGISIENLDMEVYDNITKGHAPDYEGLNVVNNQKFVDKKIQEEKKEMGKGKVVESNENKMNVSRAEEQYAELKTGLKNDKLINNIKSGKDTKPSIRTQLSASTSQQGAEKHWEQLSSNYSDLFKNKYHFVNAVDLGEKGRFYRLQVGYFDSNESAKEFCTKYITLAKKNGTDCIVIQSD